ncbi:MAG: adenine nucleotide alpha hydrolase family protein [Chloroflexi bacterium]|nr:adenine nucleotide alpha hydrolase family protein [Chloroflexota bacterium]
MRCRKCGEKAAIEIRRHNTAFCAPHFVDHFRDQVERAIRGQRMFGPDQRVLVAVSGGKDSLALWDVLLDLGYRTSGLYIGLGIGAYSAESQQKCETFAAARGADLLVVDLAGEYGFDIGEIPTLTRRAPCSACGLSKRYLFNKVARERGFDVVATGHNLDDEAATLLGNVLHWQAGYLARQSPLLEESAAGLARKVKPLYRLGELETAAYAVLRGIDYIVEECPNSVGATSLRYKEALNLLEATSPGTKMMFLQGFLDRARALFVGQEQVALHDCPQCGQPTTGDACAFCRLIGEVQRRKAERAERRARRAVAAAASAQR